MSTQIDAVDIRTAVTAEDIWTTLGRGRRFRTLATALQATGMAAQLRSEGPFTLFAPSNSAFSNLAAGTLDSLLKPASKERLSWILSCHIVEGRVDFARLLELSTVKTQHGELVRIFTEGESLKIDGAQVTERDVECRNGLIHVIDQVILPGR